MPYNRAPLACIHVILLKRVSANARSGVLGSAQLKQCFMGLLTSVLPLLGLPSYNGVEDEKQTVAASPIAYAAKDCLQAVCNLLGPSAYLGTAAQLFLSSSATDKEAVHLAEVPYLKLPHHKWLRRKPLFLVHLHAFANLYVIKCLQIQHLWDGHANASRKFLRTLNEVDGHHHSCVHCRGSCLLYTQQRI